MADFQYFVTRTEIQVQGKQDEDALRKTFDELRGDWRISMLYSYNEQTNMTEIFLAPVTIAEEYIGVENGKLLNTRTVFELDKLAMPKKYLQNSEAFIEDIWMPAKKKLAKYNVALPKVFDRGDYFSFELISSSEYCEKGVEKTIWGETRKVKHAGVDFRNKAMMDCKLYIMRYFADIIEEAPRANALAETIDCITRELSDGVYCGPEQMAI